jgi:hypothetical protein
MAKIEQLELEAHREQLQVDVRKLVDKYLAIAEWNVPDIDEPLAYRLIIGAIRLELEHVEQASSNPSPQ